MAEVRAGETIRATPFNAEIAAFGARLDYIESTGPRVRGAIPSTVSVPSDAETALSLQAVQYNVGGIHPGGTTATLTIPVAGIYIITGHARVDINTDGIRRLIVRRNGVTDVVATQGEGTGGTDTPLVVAAEELFDAGETLQLLVFQDSTVDLDVIAGWISVRYVGTAP